MTTLMSPVRSMTPMTSPVSGSTTGAAEHVQRWTGSVKCSAAKTWTAWPAATAVPIAFVPAEVSLHSAPSMKFMSSAARFRSVVSPLMLRSIPSASETTSRLSDSSSVSAMHCWMRPLAPRSGWSSHIARAPSSSTTDLAGRRPVGSTPASRERMPGVGDRPADVGRAGVLVVALQAIVDEVLPRVAQLTRPLGRDRVDVDGKPGA